ncbi:IS1182 family transposase ISBusp4 [Achromobacter aegrifaciens]|uniref:IS1182 family transposase n=1 Tax=Achromobacter aegrifaciens TaxID=1287736 RepID=UPI001467E350|nr:IS1182 family transposase [Achromobacter aegrifaciens]CAB3883215.1 IS1182 family transposase ISBusp4 [Achromobacter aegrifaciens]
MPRFIEGQDRQQVALVPECLDDFITDDNPVRIIDAFVDELNLESLGFEKAAPAATGRPSYHPAVLLKIYIYGYLNRVQSSRRLERECQRNVELMWLVGRLAPDFKTIADFRRDNGSGIRNVCRRFVAVCRDLKLFGQALVAVDGSKFKAVNTRDKNFTAAKIDKRQQQIEESIHRYLAALDTADRTQPVEIEARTNRLNDKIERLRKQMRALEDVKERLKDSPDGQLSVTDPDARSMATSGRGSGMVGYNVQMVVEAKHHLIVAHEVTNRGHDRDSLASMTQAAREAMGKKRLRAIADRGYYSAPQIKACAETGIDAILPKPTTSNAKAEGRFDRSDFIYIAKDDEYLCPAGQRAIHRFTREENGLQLRRYWSSACPQCAMKERCTPSAYRRISRWEHEAVLEAAQRRLDQMPEAMKVRRRTVEHVFGTFKNWMGYTHFLTRRLGNVSTEMSLNVLAYNLKRVMRILGFQQTMKAMLSMGG